MLKKIIFLLGIAACYAPFYSNASDDGKSDEVVIVDVSLKLFIALASYNELLKEEKEYGEGVNGEIVPAIEDIIAEFEKEVHHLKALSEHLEGRNKQDVQARVDKIQKHLEDFARELQYRRKKFELELLLQKQKELMEQHVTQEQADGGK